MSATYLRAFTLASQEAEEGFWDPLSSNPKTRRTCYSTHYPFGVFRRRKPGAFTFDPVTIFYGGNGSGKSTLLNIMAEALGLLRGAVYNRSDFFSDYIALCRWDAGALPPHSRILTSDDVFPAVSPSRSSRTKDSSSQISCAHSLFQQISFCAA